MMDLKGFGTDVKEELMRRAEYVVEILNSLIEHLKHLEAYSEVEELKGLRERLRIVLRRVKEIGKEGEGQT
jgi:predicted nucleic acid-binding protein